MSLAINPNDVISILLADGWHDIKRRSFYLDSYEYVEDDVIYHGGGASGICATGFSALLEAAGISAQGPLTSILAVMTD